MKKIWIFVSGVAALLAGLFLYEGGKLFLEYQDNRQGFLVTAAGIAEAAVFAWGFYKASGRAGTAAEPVSGTGRRRLLEDLVSALAMGAALSGLVVYQKQLYGVRVLFLKAAAVTVVLLLLQCLVLVVQRIVPLREKRFQSGIRKRTAGWEREGRLEYDGTAVRIAASAAGDKYDLMELVGIVFACCTGVWLFASSSIRFPLMGVVLVFGTVIWLLVKCSLCGRLERQIICALEDGDAKGVLGFFAAYYKDTRYKSAGTAPLIQQKAVIAMYELGEYADGLKLLQTIVRNEKTEPYYLLYRWIGMEAAGDRQGCLELVEELERVLKLIKVRERRNLWPQFELIRDFTYRHYSKVLERIERDPVKLEEQPKWMQRLAEDARKQVFGTESIDLDQRVKETE